MPEAEQGGQGGGRGSGGGGQGRGGQGGGDQGRGGRAAWGPWLSDPGSAAVLLDFDGTLTAIVADPETSRPLAGVLEALAALTHRYRLVAVVSGRPASFLARHLAVPGLDLFGSYGLEHVVGGRVEVAREAEHWREVVAGVVERARREAPAGVGIEDKGVSVTLHVRPAPEHEPWVRAFAARQGRASGLAIHEARMSLELRPPLTTDKGTIVARLVADAKIASACFIGDDSGDLSAFRALDGVATALRVAVRSPETPAELLAAADLVVEGPAGVLELLNALVPPD